MQKKYLLIGIVITLILIIILYFLQQEHKLICTYQNHSQKFIVKTKYVITYQKNIVKKIETLETVKTNDELFLMNYKEQLENTYKSYNQLKYYNNKISIKNKTLISKTIINYEKLNMDKFIKLDPNNAILLNNKKQIEINTLKKMYQKSEIICK